MMLKKLGKLGIVGESWGSPQPLKALYSKGLRAFLGSVGVNVNIDKKKILYIAVWLQPIIPPQPQLFVYIYDNT